MRHLSQLSVSLRSCPKCQLRSNVVPRYGSSLFAMSVNVSPPASAALGSAHLSHRLSRPSSASSAWMLSLVVAIEHADNVAALDDGHCRAVATAQRSVAIVGLVRVMTRSYRPWCPAPCLPLHCCKLVVEGQRRFDLYRARQRPDHRARSEIFMNASQLVRGFP